ALMTDGRMFAAEAEQLKEQFVAFGLPDTFLADLGAAVERLRHARGARGAAVDRLEHAVRGRATGKTSQTAAQAGIDAAIVSGLDAARMLDVIVANQFRGDPVTRTEWQTARRVDGGRRSR